MLALAGYPLGLKISVLTSHSDDPAAQVCGSTHLGSINKEKDLRKFLEDLKAVTFESEFVDIAKVAHQLSPSTYVFPNLKAIETIQDRETQKRLLDQFKIATSSWLSVKKQSDLEQAKIVFPKGFVLKQRRFGYDGYGTFVFKNGAGDESVLNASTNGFIAEKFIAFKRELAISFVRSRSGSFLTLPLVESVQINSRCFSVKGPIQHPGIKKLERSFKKMMTAIDYVGVLAVELFDTGKELLVNELAPRVHNSAHYSVDALTCSQFEYHWRAGLDFPLPKVELKRPAFAMVNLLGEGGDIRLSYKPWGHLHWYGKNENRPGRKLGHINTLALTPSRALAVALKWRKDFRL